jgi:hypothetical protein
VDSTVITSTFQTQDLLNTEFADSAWFPAGCQNICPQTTENSPMAREHSLLFLPADQPESFVQQHKESKNHIFEAKWLRTNNK